uniref:Peptidase M14 domain-containing protein n=1 Tax=Magallana gigas TaxID=29159 RepID=A0A8W8NX31_MAGGI|nr:carboxypeptidase B [Crassostrea gigas]
MGRKVLQSCVLLVLFYPAIADQESQKSYFNDKLVQLIPNTEEQVTLLQQMQTTENVDFWTPPKKNAHVDVHVQGENFEDFMTKVTDAKIHHNILSNNLQKNIDDEKVAMKAMAEAGGDTVVGNYATYDQINDWMSQMAMSYPDLATVESIGLTWEGRETKMMKLGKENSMGTPKPVIWIEGGIHAREWIVPATAVYIINKLLEEYNIDDKVTSLMNAWDIHIVPTVNPDGYVFSHERDRLWRKNRRPAEPGPGKKCVGVDGNRNFDVDFGNEGVSFDPCSQVYLGPAPFSEKETQNIRDAVLAEGGRIKIYLSWHSYSQLLLVPWGYTTDLPTDYQELYDVAVIAADALTSVYGTEYIVGNGPEILYPVSGAANDWAKAVAGVKFAYAYEFRPATLVKRSGFILPPEEIVPNSEEVFASLVAMAEEVAKTL